MGRPTLTTRCADAHQVAIDLGRESPTGADDLSLAAAVGRVAAHDLSARSAVRPDSAVTPSELIVRAGEVLEADRIALLGRLGVTSILCRRLPTATVVLVGGESPAMDVAGAALPDLLRAGGAEVTVTVRVEDGPDAVVRALSGARTDLLVCREGSTDGGTDHLRSALSALMADELGTGATPPTGVPVWIGRLPRVGLEFHEPVSRIVFGLPHAADDALTAAELFVVPTIQAMTGRIRAPSDSAG